MNFLSDLATIPTTVPTTEGPQLFFQPENFVSMLPKMGIGMLVIFVIIGVIILTAMLINKIFSKKN